MRSSRRGPTLPGVALALLLAAPAAGAQPGGQPNTGTGPKLPPTGAITRDSAYERKVLEQMKAPDGFTMTVFAGPPVAMYPTVVAPAPDGSVYVGVDLNLAQGAVKGRGRVMRLVDTDGDGRADRYSTFLDVDSPRGIATDGNTVYVLHPPNLTAYRDTTGDGIADWSEVLVKDIGFSLDVRSSDHSTNNITLGPDGWIYIATGDYGYLNATGKDGAKITRHGGSLARVRPDGTGLEMYTVGTRNIYDVGIDPLGHAFARDNTNDGGGWDTRFHYLAPGANMGYPNLFRYFPEEHMRSIADYGAGSGTAGLWLQDPGFPDEWNNTLYTGDWTVNRVFHHVLTRKGASYTIAQRDFMTVPRAIDFSSDGRSHVYVASLIGGVFNYAGDTVGAIVRVSFPGKTPAAAVDFKAATDAQLVDAVVSNNATNRIWAQQELVRRKATGTVARLTQLAGDRARPVEARASAVFTMKRLAGARGNAALVRLAADPTMRETALRALADDRTQLAGVPVALFVQGLADTSLAVRVEALHGLVRLDARDRARDIVPLLLHPDSAIVHLAVRSLVALGARDVAMGVLTGPDASPVQRARARQVVQDLHDAGTVTAVVTALGTAKDPVVRRELLLTAARLYNTDSTWAGDWWGTHPSTLGPYFRPVTWSESARLRPVLRDALLAATGDDARALTEAFGRNRVLPAGAGPLMLAVASDQAMRQRVVDALVGTSQVVDASAPLLLELDRRPGLHGAVTELIAGEPTFGSATMPLARAAALDTTLSPEVRGRLLTAFTQLPGDAGRDAAIDVLARVTPRPLPPGTAAPATPPTPVEAAWRRYVGDFARIPQMDHFIALTKSDDPAQRTLAYAVLLQSVRTPRTLPAVRAKVTPVIDAAWNDPAATPTLVDAIRIMRVESQYTEKLQSYDNKVRK